MGNGNTQKGTAKKGKPTKKKGFWTNNGFIVAIICVVILAGGITLYALERAKNAPPASAESTATVSTINNDSTQSSTTNSTSNATTNSNTSPAASIAPDTSSLKPDGGKSDEAFKYQMQAPQAGDTVAVMKTSMGEIKIKLFPNEAPKAVENFTKLAEKGYYNGLTFHRVIKDFMIQGGDPKGDGTGGESIWGNPFEDEFSSKLHNFRGALSMANSGKNTNGSQFFIVQKQSTSDLSDALIQSGVSKELYDLYMKTGGTPWLDNKHTVFGQVYEGLNIVDAIAAVQASGDKPVNDIKIEKIEIKKM